MPVPSAGLRFLPSGGSAGFGGFGASGKGTGNHLSASTGSVYGGKWSGPDRIRLAADELPCPPRLETERERWLVVEWRGVFFFHFWRGKQEKKSVLELINDRLAGFIHWFLRPLIHWCVSMSTLSFCFWSAPMIFLQPIPYKLIGFPQ